MISAKKELRCKYTEYILDNAYADDTPEFVEDFIEKRHKAELLDVVHDTNLDPIPLRYTLNMIESLLHFTRKFLSMQIMILWLKMIMMMSVM